ncbi:MAG TPA: nucleotidyltransferase family protein [Thermomicrobiales bacterium]|nr:nucleotidyltransferase family protein [Thermomicrobiales bacterium]
MFDVAPTARLLARFAETGELPAPPAGLAAGDVTRWFQRNKYPLLALAPLAPAWLADDPTFRRELAAERAWYETQRAEYVLARAAWLEQGIDCLMIKSAGNAPSFPHTSDNIDILFRREQAVAARETLRRLGYIELRNVEEPQKHLFRKFHDGRCVSAIHVHERVGWAVGFMDEAELWARLRPAADDPLVNVPSPEDAILINLAHACYENKRLRLNDVARVRHVLRATEGRLDWAYLERVAAGNAWLEGLRFMLLAYAALEPALYGSALVPAAQQERCREGLRAAGFIERRLDDLRAAPAADLPLDLSYWYCKRLYYRKVLRDPTRTPRQRWRDAGLTLLWGVKLKTGMRPQPGMIVALSGPDGSGKTAHAEALVGALRLCGLRTQYVWNRGGSTGLVGAANALRRLPGRGDRAAAPECADPLQRRRRHHPLARFAWAWLVAADQVGAYLLRARLPALCGRIVVADRYAYDTAVEMDLSLPPDARWSRLAIAAMLRLTPRPHRAYALDVSAETARARKRDEPWHADFAAERRRYRDLAPRWGLRPLSTEGAFADSNDPLIRDVGMAFMADIETWRNGLLLANPSQLNPPDLAWARGGGR